MARRGSRPDTAGGRDRRAPGGRPRWTRPRGGCPRRRGGRRWGRIRGSGSSL